MSYDKSTTQTEQKNFSFEEDILTNSSDLTARYMAACNLHLLVKNHPHCVREKTLLTLERMMRNEQLPNHRQSFFLFREIALAMTEILAGQHNSLSHHALDLLKRLLRTTKNASHRAVTEAIGSLAFSIPCQDIYFESQQAVPVITWHELISKTGFMPADDMLYRGRSLTTSLTGTDKILVVKFARNPDDEINLHAEIKWMQYLKTHFLPGDIRFDIPEPLQFDGLSLFTLHETPIPPKTKRIAVAFTAHKDYFSYVNEPQHLRNFTDFSESMVRNSFLLGFFAALGNVHTAPIPLFHNRVQRNRREDNGLYNWPLGGRLDQWLASCRHPNMGLSGIRDFEHFIAIEQSGEKLYWHIGTHILSLLLVCASYFRNKQSRFFGTDVHGNPIDATTLFNRELLPDLINDIFKGYYRGFVGNEFQQKVPFDTDILTNRIIEEMGVDKHMEEELRLIDQLKMTDKEFRHFLVDRGFSAKKASFTAKDRADIVLQTGPHLGGFNQRISIPEIIEATASMAATCVLGRFTKEQYQS